MSISLVSTATFRRNFFYVCALLGAFSCSTSGGSADGGADAGISAIGPIPGGHFTGVKTDNAVNLRLSANGINYLNSNWQQLVGVFAPGNHLTLPFPCTVQTFPVINVVRIADQNLSYICEPGEAANIDVTVAGFALLPSTPDKLNVSISLTIDTNKIYASVDGSVCNLKCSVRFNSAANNPATNQISATVKFSIDTKWDKLLAFEVTTINGAQICGASGAPPEPSCINANDLDISSEGGVCSVACSGADWAPVKTFVLQQISPLLQTQITKAVAGQECQSCESTATCPQWPGAVSTCVDKQCIDAATSKCVPRFLGVENRVSLGAFLGNFGAPADSQMDLSLAAGSTVAVDQGMSIGTRAGTAFVGNVASCVPALAPPPMLAVAAPDFEGEATPGSGFHVALSFSSSFINNAFYNAHQAGALCIQMSTANVGLINTDLFKTFLPSLGKIATRDGKGAPMMVALRPAKAPMITVGLGTYDPVTKKPIKPLLTLVMPELSIDFYAQIDDRMARLFTLKADITLPLSLIFEGCDKVTPAIGDVRMLVSNISTDNSEMLAEDPHVLADLIPAVVGLAEPALGSALKPFMLPALGNFKLKVNEVKGLGNIAGSEAYNHLGIYATLLPLNAACAVSSPHLVAQVKRAEIPTAGEMKLTGHGLKLPKAILEVATSGKSGTGEYSVRIDNGFWTEFHPALKGELEVEHARFLMQGIHTIDIRARVAEDTHGVSESQTLNFAVDWEGPEMTLTADAVSDRIVLKAHDELTATDKIQFAYALGSEAFGEFGAARDISLKGVEAAGGFKVRARDEMGNVSETAWRVPTVALRPVDATLPELATSKGAPATGCTSVSGFSWLALLGLALVLKRRA